MKLPGCRYGKIAGMVIRRRHLIYLILLIALAVRLLLLFNGQRYVDGDEAVVGIMAKHITEGARPIARYGQHYGGGHVIEAYLTALFFVIAGVTNSSILLKLPVVLFSVMTIYLSYLIIRRFSGYRHAIITAALLALAAPFLRSGFKVNGYIETIFFSLVSFYFFAQIVFERKNGLKNFFWCGIWLGIAFWSFGFALIYLAVYLLYFLFYERLSLFRYRIWGFLSGFLLGCSVLIIDNLLNNAGPIGVIIAGEEASLFSANWLTHFLTSSVKTFTTELPAFLGREAVHNFVSQIPILSWIYYVILLIAITHAVYLLIKNGASAHKLELFCLIYFIAHISAYSFSSFAGVSPRYFLGLFPFITILTARLILALLDSGKLLRTAGLAMLLSYLTVQTSFASGMAHNQTVLDLNITAPAKDVISLIDFLNQIGIKHVHTGFFLKWRLIFKSDEQILASCHNLGPKIKKYPYYERVVEMSPNYAVVFHTKSKYRRYYYEFLMSRGINFQSEIVDDLTVFYDISGNFRP